MTDGNICSSDVWRQISDAQSAVGKLKRKRERCRTERLKFIGKRLVYLVIMLFGVATLVFILTKLVPGDPVTANLSQRALGDPQIVAAYKAKYGLDQPIIVQYVYYMKNLLHFDLGTSIRTNNAVLSELARCYPATIELAVFAIILATLFGILFGVISAIKRNSILDQIVRAISVTGVSLPSFWFALLVLYFFYYKLQILPGPGRLGNAFSAPQTVTGFFVIDSLLEGDIPKALDALRHLILPGTVLAAFTMGLITRTTRSNLLDVMSTDYIRTARAKGLSNVRLIIHHALGNALIPVLTVIGLGFGNLLGGMVLVETIFNWPGVGQFAYQSVLSNDYPSIIGVALLIALNYMIINTVVDILYGIIDPRVRCSYMLHSLKKMFKSNYLFTFGVIICLFWIIMAIIAPFVAPYDPVVQDLTLRLKAPSAAHIFGTDNFGRDIFSRVIYGGRYSLLAGCLTVVIAGCIGTIYGAIAGYVGGAVDNVMMRLSEMILSFPSLILAMIINAVMGSNLFNTMFALVIVAWPSYARVMRSVVLSVRENEYVTASEALGASRIRILLKEIIPNSITSVLIMATTDIGNQILMFSTLSFLGLGSAPPTPEWGMMVSDGVQYFNKFWVAGFPGLAIFTMAVGANFIGDGLRDLLDPKLRKQF